jgi:hypothetical protein
MKRYVDHYQGERKQDRRTPKEFFDKLNSRFGFTLDGAATSENSLLPKYSTETAPVPWEGERVFCNPPWSNIRPFVELASKADAACLLVPARTNCKWFHRALELGAKTEFWQGKLSFDGPWNSPIDCLLLLWGNELPEKCGHEAVAMSGNHYLCQLEENHPGTHYYGINA